MARDIAQKQAMGGAAYNSPCPLSHPPDTLRDIPLDLRILEMHILVTCVNGPMLELGL